MRTTVAVLVGMLTCLSGCTGPQGTGGLDSGIRGMVLLGPTCPVQREPPDPECADKPYQTSLVVTTPDGSHPLITFDSDKDGAFRVPVPPGDYAIRSAGAANTRPYCASDGTVTVVAKSFTETAVHCDTGIR